MFIYQNGKLYIRKDDNKIVGVNFSLHNISEIKGTDDVVGDDYKSLHKFEVIARFNITEDNEYKFPKPKKASKPKIEVEKVLEETTVEK